MGQPTSAKNNGIKTAPTGKVKAGASFGAAAGKAASAASANASSSAPKDAGASLAALEDALPAAPASLAMWARKQLGAEAPGSGKEAQKISAGWVDDDTFAVAYPMSQSFARGPWSADGGSGVREAGSGVAPRNTVVGTSSSGDVVVDSDRKEGGTTSAGGGPASGKHLGAGSTDTFAVVSSTDSGVREALRLVEGIRALAMLKGEDDGGHDYQIVIGEDCYVVATGRSYASSCTWSQLQQAAAFDLSIKMLDVVAELEEQGEFIFKCSRKESG